MSAQRFTPEFKEEAVKQVRDRGYGVPEVAARLGVSAHSLYKWVKAVSPDKSEQQSKELLEAKSEILRLRAQMRRVEEERDLLKKPSRAIARLCAVETANATISDMEGSGRQLIGGAVPVKKRGPWVHANLRVVTLFQRRSRLGR